MSADVIDLSGVSAFDSFSDLSGTNYVEISGTTFILTDGLSIQVTNVGRSELDADNFVF